jgi:lipopolysaccharide export LptBFGC system permease protein LptF
MTTLIKLAYAGAIMVFLVLAVAFGTRVVYQPPHAPEFPRASVVPRPTDPDGTPRQPTQEELDRWEEAQRRYQEAFKAYEDERAFYRRNVFLIAAVAGLIAVAAGVSLDARLDAMRLGLVLGGVGTLIYAIAQAAGDLGRMGPAALFVVALVGLALLLAAGYRWLSLVERER